MIPFSELSVIISYCIDWGWGENSLSGVFKLEVQSLSPVYKSQGSWGTHIKC